MGILGFPIFLISVIFAAMVFTWLYNSTDGSLLMVVLFHAIFNWLSVSEAGGQFVAPIMSAPIILWALFVARRSGIDPTGRGARTKFPQGVTVVGGIFA